MSRRAIGLAACAIATVVTEPTLADPPADYFRAGTAALSDGRFDEAIAQLEAHADREAPHPDASFNRGIAYVTRVRNSSERPGDLGRAAAAFEETLLMRPSDDQAKSAVTLVRAEVARRRSRGGKNVVTATPSLDRAIVGLISPRAWAIAAIAAGWLFALGLALRRREGPAHLAGTLLVPFSGVAMACLLPAALWSDHIDRTRRPAVLVASEAFLSDEQGNTMGGDPITEGARVELGAHRGDRVRVRYGTREGWVAIESVRVLRGR
jgi:hypothetical protein